MLYVIYKKKNTLLNLRGNEEISFYNLTSGIVPTAERVFDQRFHDAVKCRLFKKYVRR